MWTIDMKNLLLIIFLAIVALVSCSPSTLRQYRLLTEAESVVETAPDSALAMLESVEPADLKQDSLKALYAVVIASAHKANISSMASDTLTRFACDYYKDKSIAGYVRSADLYAMHRFWSGDVAGALGLLDSLTAAPAIPDSLKVRLLQTRVKIGGSQYDCENSIRILKHLQEIDTVAGHLLDYKYQLNTYYQFAGKSDSALILIDELIEDATRKNQGERHFEYSYEKIGILEELGRYRESNAMVDYILDNAPHNSAIPYLRFWKALNYFNMGDYGQASRELAIADSIANGRDDVEINYYESFAGPLREFLTYRTTGVIKLIRLARTSNSMRDNFQKMESMRFETENSLLKAENRALVLKSQNERKTAIIIIVVLTTILVAFAAVWNVQKRKRRILEAEERAEVLQKMVDEMKVPQPSGHDTLRRAMLRELGIIKMVAGTPTEQNREMLRKISSMDSDTNGALVNWENVYEIIDSLYSGFHTRLHESYGDVLTDKEEQIIVLMVAGFSTKEISVITTQTTSTVYVRKSSIRKKLGVPEKEDIVEFLHRPSAH